MTPNLKQKLKAAGATWEQAETPGAYKVYTRDGLVCFGWPVEIWAWVHHNLRHN